MKFQQIKDELLKIWPTGAECSHIHAATAFKLLDELIEEEKESTSMTGKYHEPIR